MIGKTISHYRITEKLGEDGMTVVYEAVDTKLDRPVALKILPPELTRDPDAKARFVHEAKATAALAHPNICTIHEIDEFEGQSFLAIEWYDGETLKERIVPGSLNWEESVDIAQQIAQGLAKAHEQDIVHRGIKPASIFITSDGLVKILDFGLAILSGQTLQTKTDITPRTAGYMAPEQVKGETTDQRTDFWCLGVTLYEMVSGRLPFQGDHEQAIVHAILNQEPDPVTGLRTGIPLGLERIIGKCLSKNPAERYQHADELTADLLHLGGDTTSGSRATGAIQGTRESSLIGQTVSHYRITRQLGAGGMGVIYEAVDTKLDRTVALKFLPPESTRDSDARVRFIREAKAASGLDHPNICTVHEIGATKDGQMFIAMALYQGCTLAHMINNGPLSVDQIMDIGSQVAAGLAKAHESGIIHRDIKPLNIFVTEDGLVKILDFGLAKLSGQSQLTVAGATLGTPAYMSPEQANGGEVDQRTDLWSLGIVLYEMTTGHPPFRADFPQGVIYGILNHDPEPLRSLRSEIPESLEKVVNTTLQKKAESRYPMANALLEDLGFPLESATGQAGVDIGSPNVSNRTLPRSVRISAVVGLFLLAVVLVVFGVRILTPD